MGHELWLTSFHKTDHEEIARKTRRLPYIRSQMV
jgi:hypothetical protein